MNKICYGALLLFFCMSLCAQPKKPASARPVPNGENYITVSGYPYKDVKCIFSQLNQGGWYVTDNTAFLNLELEGTSGGSHFVMWLIIDGTPGIRSYNISRFTDIMGNGESFAMNFERQANGDITRYQADENHTMHVEITAMDNNHLQFSLSGKMSDGAGGKLEGKFNLTQASPSIVRVLKESYKDCSNTIYDKMSGAQNRSATECEIKFDQRVKTTLDQVFRPAIAALERDHWKVNAATDITPIREVGRHSEEYVSKLGNYELQMQLENTSEAYAAYYKKYTDAMSAIRTNTSNNPEVAKANYERLQKVGYEYKSNANANIIVRINYDNADIYSFKAEHKVIQITGAAYAVQCTYVAGRSGGDVDNSMDATFIFIGKWKPAVVVKKSDGSESIRLNGGISKTAPTLGVQNMLIRMECSAAVAKKILDRLDVQKLASLVN